MLLLSPDQLLHCSDKNILSIYNYSVHGKIWCGKKLASLASRELFTKFCLPIFTNTL